MVKSKYIVIEHDGYEAVIVFSPFLLHEDVARNSKVLSAGFCKVDSNGRWAVSGESVSLNKRAMAIDANYLHGLLPLGGCILQSGTLAF